MEGHGGSTARRPSEPITPADDITGVRGCALTDLQQIVDPIKGTVGSLPILVNP